jgi:DNA-binding FadR family transcriptional regulator
MKKLEQLGVANIAQGGARVAPLHEASLDIIGHMLALGDLPDEDLVDQILLVIRSLMTLAAESAVERASDQEIEHIRQRVQVLLREDHDRASLVQARFELMGAIMQASGNLVCRLIARSLLLQFAPRMVPLEEYVEITPHTHRAYARRLDAALAARDVEAVRATFETLSNFNRESARQAFAALKARRNGSDQVLRS